MVDSLFQSPAVYPAPGRSAGKNAENFWSPSALKLFYCILGPPAHMPGQKHVETLLEKAFFSTKNCVKEQAPVVRPKDKASLNISQKESMLRGTKRRR